MFRAATLSVLLILVLAAPAAAQGRAASGGPGEKAVWTEADKDGFGTATSLRSRTG